GGKLAGALMAIFGASIIAFVFMRVLPGDPARLIAGPLASQEAIDTTRDQLGLNDRLDVQYYKYISNFFQGNWGFSFGTGEPVSTLIGDRLPASIELGLYPFLFSFVAAVLPALPPRYRGWRVGDGSVRALSFCGLGPPPFWFALPLLIVSFEQLKGLPGPQGRWRTPAEPPPAVTLLYTIDALIAGQFGT